MVESEVPGEGELLVVGRISRPHGLRGAVIVEGISDWPERFSRGARLLLKAGSPRLEEVTIESCSPHQGRLLVSLSGLTDRESADRLRGGLLLIPAGEAVPLGEGEYWIHDLVGMSVVREEGGALGVVTGFVEGAAQDLLVVEDADKREFDIPFVGEFIKKVDREASTITVRVIEGLVPRD
ncbi:MAG: ribosome maturation factor RimM [Actinobacteria bacterium]|nr:ribosome maturation factor RimM [Actinomycetota bacterium]